MSPIIIYYNIFPLFFCFCHIATYITTRLSKEDTRNTSSSSKSTRDTNNEWLQEECHYPLYVARFSYLATDSDMLSFKKGDFFYIISDKEDWWYARARHSGRKGYIPSNYLKKYIPLEGYRYVCMYVYIF